MVSWELTREYCCQVGLYYTGPVSTCTSDIINTRRRRHRAVQLSPRWRDGLHMSTDADGFTRTERFSAPFRSQLPADRCHLATLPIWPSAVTVERRAPSVNTRRRHYRTFATLWSVNASVDHCWFVMTAKTAFGPCCLYYVCSLCLEFLRYLTNEKDIGIFVLAFPYTPSRMCWMQIKEFPTLL